MRSLITHPEADTVTGLFGYPTKDDIPENDTELHILIIVGLAFNALNKESSVTVLLVLNAAVSDKINDLVSLLRYMETYPTDKQQALATALHRISTS